MESENKPIVTRGSAPQTDWSVKLWQALERAEDWIDAKALRLGDAIFGAVRTEKIFGPHPHAH